jgi:signal peptidase I
MKIIKSLMPYIIIIIVVILVRTFIATPVRVNGSSMYPTLKGNEIMLLNKLGHINRFDIVVLKIDGREDNLIKRIIGLPGETVEIKDNDIYINDKKIEDKYGYGVTYNIDKVTLKEDEYFILGDNRKISLDSRVFGTIHKDEIKGTTNFIMYPFKSFGKVK